jgi:hypothetical protein
MFSINDTIRCENNEFVEDELTVGKVYDVIEALPADGKVRVRSDEGRTPLFFDSRFILVTNVERPSTPSTRAFDTGATRDTDENKLDFEGFLSPLVMERFAQHMHAARKMPDGTMRASDNWQLGIPLDVYMKSMWRHFFDVWKTHRGMEGATDIETELCALRFNVDGMLHEILKAKQNKPQSMADVINAGNVQF